MRIPVLVWWAWVLYLFAGAYPVCSQELNYRPYEYFVRFENLSVNEGLSQSTGRDILYGTRGFIWIATQDGLNQYNGQGFKLYNKTSGDDNSLTDNFILSLEEDGQGNIWIGTNGSGVDQFNPELLKFVNYRYNENDSLSLSNDLVNDIFEDSQGHLWFGTNHGLNLFSRLTRKFTRYFFDTLSPGASFINCVYEDSRGHLWIGTNGGGLLEFDRDQEKVVRQLTYDSDQNSIGGNVINSVLEDSKGHLWIAGLGCSLTKWDVENDQFTIYENDPEVPGSISSNSIYSLYESHFEKPVLWIGTARDGLSRYIPETNSFVNYRNDPSDPFSLCNDVVFSLESSDDGTMWVGTGGGGISKFSLRRNKFHTFRNPEGRPSNFIWSLMEYDADHTLIGTQNSGLYLFDRRNQHFESWLFDKEHPKESRSYDVYTLYMDHEDAIWIGSSDVGIFRINEKKNIYERYGHISDDSNSLASNWVRSICQVSDSIIWLGTSNGLNRFNTITKRFRSYKPIPGDTNSLSYPVIQGLLMDQQGYLWVGTYGGGLNRLDPQKGKFRQYIHSPGKQGSISNNRIRTIFEDKDGEIWIGTDHGLNHYNREKDNFSAITMEDGLANNVIYSILPDKHGNFWMSTNHGISVYNLYDSTIINYDVQDGLQSNEFNTGAYYLSEQGEMYFGGISGFNIFHPDSIQQNTFIPPVKITNLYLFNEPLKPGENGLISRCISTLSQIRLEHDQNFISLEFASFNYINSEKNQYRYKMEGMDEDWVYAGNRGYASYPDMKPGDYVFRVIGSNNDGVWNEIGDELKITIIPPWWQSTLAYILYGFTLVLFVFAYIRLRTQKLSRDKSMLEEQVRLRTSEIANQKEEIESQRDSLEEMNASKDKLFTIIGHDLKNPLTTLLSVSHTLKENLGNLSPVELKKAIQSVDHSAQNLFRLLDNLLEWTKSQTGRTPKVPRRFYLNDVIRENILYLSSSAKKKEIIVEYEIDESQLVFADKNMISTVVRNLLANAIKFTHRGGLVKVCCQKSDSKLLVKVIDNGIGISEENKIRLFKMDTSATSRGTENEKGSGLGLLICKDFVEKNGGTIWAEKNDDKGSTFYFTVPVSN
jgi:signal transduction histidine kinase/ligand-binding sensor domain-containing protein